MLMLEEAEKERASIRLERGLDDLRNDRLGVVKNSDFISNFTRHLFALSRSGDSDKAQIYLDKLFEYLAKTKYAGDIQPVLDKICNKSLESSNIRLLRYLTDKYCTIIKISDCKYRISLAIRDFLTKSCSIFIRSGQWRDFDIILTSLWKVRNRTFITENGQEKIFKGIFNKIAAKDVVEKLFRYHIGGDNEQKDFAARSIRYLGDEAILYLLNRLVFSTNKEERFLLIDLLAGFGEEIVKVLHVYMEEDLPWYAVRNLIVLIGEIGNSAYYAMIEGYLIHPDIRVQRQVIGTILKLAGSDAEMRLIQALPIVDDTLKIKIAMQLGSFSSEKTADGLLETLRKRKTFSAEIRDDLVQKLCISLRSYPYAKVTNYLNLLLKEVEQEQKDNLLITIGESIKRLEPKIRHRLKEEKAEADLLSYDLDTKIEKQDSSTIDDFLQDVDKLLATGKLEKASSVLYAKILDLAHGKDFTSAEMLRDKLLEVNPDALEDVIRAAEIIEEEKSSPTSGVQVEIWQKLFSRFSSSEYTSLLNALRTENYSKEEKIVITGEIDPCLYFLNAGIIRLTCNSGSRETFLKRIQPGDVMGVTPFFSASVWTVNMTALQNARLLVLRRDLIQGTLEKHPQIEEKLFDFCKEKDTIPDLVKMSGQERRDNARYAVNITVNNILLGFYGDSEGKRIFHGEMIDISRGGLSFAIRISKKENAHLLLGRQIISEINLKGKDVLRCFGLIVGVNYKHEIAKEYSVHVKFYSELEQYQVSDVLNLVIG